MKQTDSEGLTRRFLRAIIPYMKQVAGLLTIGSVGGLVMNTAVVLPAILFGRTIDMALDWSQDQAGSGDVWRAGLAYAGATAFYQGARLVKRWGLRMANQRIMANVRADALRGVLNWPMEKLSQAPIGDLMARIVGDVDVMGRGISELTTEMWDTVLFSVSLIAGMLAYDPGMTLLALLPVPLGMVLAKAVGRWVSARTTEARRANAALTAFLQERLVGLRVVRLFGWIPKTVERAAELSDRLARANLAAIRLRSGLRPVYRLLMIAGIVVIIWLGGRRVAEGLMTLGAFTAYLDLYSRFVGRGHRVPQLFNSVQSGAAAYARLEPLLASTVSSGISWRSTFRPSHVPQLDRAKPLARAATVTLDRVTFRYPGNDTAVLHEVSLSVPAGSVVAVTGPVGSGKSALARALLGLYPLESGHIALDGQAIDERDPAQVSGIGYLAHSPFLFSGTIRDNILLTLSETADPGSEKRLDESLRLAALQEDVADFPRGLDTEIGERGIRLSGGQQQRVALARAFAVSPGLLVLDDPFSAVDVDTEARIIAGLRESFGPGAPPQRQATIIFFSHRLAAFPLADRVVVLDAGHIAEQGTHAELLATGGLYGRIYEAQQRMGSPIATQEMTS